MIKRRTIFSVLLAVLLVFSISGASYAIGIEAAIGGWEQSPSGYISYKSASVLDRLDLENDLGYGDETQITGRIKIDMPAIIPNIYLMGTPMSFEGTGSKPLNFSFGDITFDGTAAYSSKLDMDLYDIAFYYSIPLMQTATLNTLNMELGLNMRVVDFYGEITGTDSATGLTATETVDETIPVPMLYAGIQVNPTEKLAFEGEVRGVAYSSNHYYDLIGRVKYRLFGPLFVAAGYRYQDVKIDVDDIRAEMDFSGPFAEAGVVF